MVKDLIKSTSGDGDTSSIIELDLADSSCVSTPLGQLFTERSGLSRDRMEYNRVLLQVYDHFVYVDMLAHFGLDTDEADTWAQDAAYGLFVEYDWHDCDSIKDCQRGLELHDMCDTFKRKNVREAGFDRSGYFNAHDTLDKEAEHVQETLNKRIDELHKQRIKDKKANKQAPKLKEDLLFPRSNCIGSYGGTI